MIKTIDKFYYVSCTSKTFSASYYLEKKQFGLANIIFCDNMLVMKTLIHDMSATLKNKSKIVFLLTQE